MKIFSFTVFKDLLKLVQKMGGKQLYKVKKNQDTVLELTLEDIENVLQRSKIGNVTGDDELETENYVRRSAGASACSSV